MRAILVPLFTFAILFSIWCLIDSRFSEWFWSKESLRFEGDEYWETWEREFCDDPKKDKSWTFGDASCFVYNNGFELIHVEVMSWEPAVVIYRDLLNTRQIENYLKLIKKKKFTEQRVVDGNGTAFISTVRQANGTYTPFSKHLEAQSLFDSASRVLPDINLLNSEDMLALSYEKGGHYAVHYDFLDPQDQDESENMGHRLATFIMVLKSADSGGGTFFPSVGTVARARSGDAIFWFNSQRNGSREDDMDHGGCPVNSGQKVISTIWIGSVGQPILEKYKSTVGSFNAEMLLPQHLRVNKLS